MLEIKHDSASEDAVTAADKYNDSGSGKKKKSRRKSIKKRLRKIFGFQSKSVRKNKTKDSQSEYRVVAAGSQDKTYTSSSFDDTKKSLASAAPSLVSTIDSRRTSPHETDDEIEASFPIVLLLLDPETRRFELLNLDFESGQISVSEVLKQSSGSITSGSLQKVTYSGLMGSDGVHRRGAELLSSFCTGNDILIGIPDNTNADKMHQLASPILMDKNILQMISDSGANTTPWKKNASTSFPIVLLLLDPETRRFEIFNLDFESSQISVAEVLEQSSGLISGGALQKVTFSGLMGSDRVHRRGADLLSSFCIGNDVVVGIPENVSADKMYELASPILVDKNIVQMISESGANTTPWTNPNSPSRSTSELPGSIDEQMGPTSKRSLVQPAVENKTGGSRHIFILTMEILLGLFLILQYSMNAGYVAAPATGGDPPIPVIAYDNQNNEQMFSCIRTCIDDAFLLGEDTATEGGSVTSM